VETKIAVKDDKTVPRSCSILSQRNRNGERGSGVSLEADVSTWSDVNCYTALTKPVCAPSMIYAMQGAEVEEELYLCSVNCESKRRVSG
jgi:hypothetical protein